MDSFSRDPFDHLASDASEHQRTRSRDSLFLVARMTIVGSDVEREVRVRNLSESGLMAEFDRPLSGGTELGFDIRGIGAVRGKVVWCAEGRIGVALDEPIDPKLARKPVATRARR